MCHLSDLLAARGVLRCLCFWIPFLLLHYRLYSHDDFGVLHRPVRFIEFLGCTPFLDFRLLALESRSLHSFSINDIGKRPRNCLDNYLEFHRYHPNLWKQSRCIPMCCELPHARHTCIKMPYAAQSQDPLLLQKRLSTNRTQ